MRNLKDEDILKIEYIKNRDLINPEDILDRFGTTEAYDKNHKFIGFMSIEDIKFYLQINYFGTTDKLKILN